MLGCSLRSPGGPIGPSPPGLAAYETGVQAAGYGGISGTFDDGAAIREQRHLVGIAPELEDKVIMAHRAVGLQPSIHLGEVDGTLPLMNLHGISAAQRDVRSPFAGEVDEIALSASAATRMRFGC